MASTPLDIPIPPANDFGDLSQLPHDNKQGDIIACVVVTWLIGFGFVAARFYTRVAINGSTLGASEWTILAASVSALATSICIIMEVQFGIGAHLYDLAPGKLNAIGNVEAQWISIVFYALTLMLTKVSILLLYMNVFYHSWVRPASYVVFGIIILTHIWAFYVVFSACRPIEAFWDPSIPGAVCNPPQYFLANQYLAIATDFIMFFLPIPVVWNLKVRWKQKVLLLSLFAVGFFACTLSILRIVYISPLLANAGLDFTYNSAPIFYWTAVEINVAIVVGCAITLKPFIRRFMPSLIFSKGESTAAGTRTGASPMRGLGGTWGSMRAPGAGGVKNNHIRVDSSFTAEYGDEELGIGGGSGGVKPSMSSEQSLRKAYMG